MIEYLIHIPSNFKIKDFDLKMLIASKLFEDGSLSSGQAAQIVGLSKRSFLEILGKYNIALFGYTIEELNENLANA